MTDQEINIAIAVACGWKRRQDCDYLSKSFSGNFEKQELWELNGRVTHLPDYCHDLNAMHEAEELLNAVEQTRYSGIIGEYVKSRHWDHLGFDCLHSAARQRAEAFLRVKGLWKE